MSVRGFHRVAGAIHSSHTILDHDAVCIFPRCGRPATAIVSSWDRGRPACDTHAAGAEERGYPVNREPKRRKAKPLPPPPAP